MQDMNIAVLSNVNIDFVCRRIRKNINVADSVGYGNIWGQILDETSNINTIDVSTIFFIIDIEQLIENCNNYNDCINVIDEWFKCFNSIIKKEKDYFVSDVAFRNEIISDNDYFDEYDIAEYWMSSLKESINKCSNIHILCLNKIINKYGKDVFFSKKTWYLGKIPYTNEGSKLVAEEIISCVEYLKRIPKKVLVLDLDNTLWGGILGEDGVDGIRLSDDNIGAIYKKVQQQICNIKNNGTILAICSKNNEDDVVELWDKNTHMLLKKDDFASIKINWKDKASNVKEIAKELNLGLDSFAFIDDMEVERENIRKQLPMVVVPDFPNNIEEYPDFIINIFNLYFKKIKHTSEDLKKTRQYIDNEKRKKASEGISYEEFLKSLNLKAKRVKLDERVIERIVQLHGKTNQFNLTTRRYTRADIENLLESGCEIYAYNINDRFGDYGLTAVAIIDLKKLELLSFLMSCRIMGKLIENYVIDQIENDLLKAGYNHLITRYIKTNKNMPVENFFDKLGYKIVDKKESETVYELDLYRKKPRQFYINNTDNMEE